MPAFNSTLISRLPEYPCLLIQNRKNKFAHPENASYFNERSHKAICMKQYIVLIPLLIFIASSCFSQEIASYHRITYGIDLEPGLGYRIISNTNTDTLSDVSIPNSYRDQYPLFTFSGGVHAIYRLNTSTGLQFGMDYSRRGYQSGFESLSFIGTDPSFDPALPAFSKYKDEYSYLTIPVLLNYSPGKKKFWLTASAGLSVDYLLQFKETYYYKYRDGKINKDEFHSTDNMKRFNLSPVFVAGASYRISHHLEIKLEPAFTFSIMSPNSSETEIAIHFWNAGLHMEMNWIR